MKVTRVQLRGMCAEWLAVTITLAEVMSLVIRMKDLVIYMLIIHRV